MTKQQQKRLVSLLPNGKPRWVRIYDNGGETADRYTVVFTGRYRKTPQDQFIVLGMSAEPFSPQGVGITSGYDYQVDTIRKNCRGYFWPPAVGRKCYLGKRILFDDLPADCQRAVLQDYNEIWDLN